MTRRLEAGPLLVTLGALLLLVSLFLSWFDPDISAWEAFEAWDLVLFVLALASIAAGLGLTTQDVDLVDRRFLPAAVAAVAAIVASQIIDPPPATAGQDPETGAWLALGSALLMCLGALLTFGRVHLALTVEGRDQRRHVPAVDARGPQEPTTDSHEAVVPDKRQRLFARERTAEPEIAPSTAKRAGKGRTEEKQD
jgi:cell division septation protein DedD